ncbi:Lrp/AsnC family transcriptional regulator [Nocardia sp. NPDC049707]|uniref:Lrp/AsnC family transcriptional regulator n=1 Tax=Nocardia sp. NPDC049707 TaxID=3154735 RepID=UPI0034287797
MMESVMFDDLDRGLAHALQIDGRAPFSRIAEVLGTSENTVARRYRRLRSAGVLRVVGAVDGTRLGYTTWVLRMRCTPDAARTIGEALARRTDTYWVHILSGGTEISCATRAATPEVLVEKLPRANRILAVSGHWLLHGFVNPQGWGGLAWLTPHQADRLRPNPPEPDRESLVLGEADHALLTALSTDGRAGYAELAAHTGWSESTVRRRMEHLRRTGTLEFQVDVVPEALGYRALARLWLSVRPSALTSVGQILAGHPEVQFAAVTTGPTNMLAAIACRDSRDLYRYLTDRIGPLDAIGHLETAPVIRTLKRTGTT